MKQIATDTYFIGSILIFSFFWSIFLLSEWGTDFGVYYATAYFLGDDYQIYKQAFDHKGPLYYLFLKGIGGLLGWGSHQAYISLSLTVSFYLLTIFYVAKHHIKNTMIITITVGLSFATLYQQPSNVSIALFQSAILLMYFHTIVEYSKIKNVFYLTLSIVLLSLAILTRIDSVIYVLLFLPSGFLSLKRGIIIRKLFFELVLGVGISFIICVIIFKYLNISLAEYYLHNVDFNRWYKPAYGWGILYRPKHLTLLMVSGLLPTVIIILNKILFHNVQGFGSMIIRIVMVNRNTLSIMILLMSVVGWIYSMTDKNYHLFILVPGMLFFIISNLSIFEKRISRFYPYFILYLVFICLCSLVPSVETVIQKENLFDPFDDHSDVKRYEQTIEDMRGRSTAYIVGGRGWPYLFSRVKPTTAINNWWLYYLPEPYTTRYTLKHHNRLINSANGYEFWINNKLLKKEDTSPLLQEILEVSNPLKSDGYYTKFAILK